MSAKDENKGDEDSSNTAETYRLRGNDAFATKDWERAGELYQKSLDIDPFSKSSAKVYSNLAATLCKVGQYEDASDAAERCTKVDTKWAKGWWRRGVVAELCKEDMKAATYYYNAHSLDKKNKVFLKALQNISAKSGFDIKEDKNDPDNGPLLFTDKRGGDRRGRGGQVLMTDPEESAKTPSAKCWKRIVGEGGFSPLAQSQWEERQLVPSSEQYIGNGLIDWYRGMSSALACLVYQYQMVNEECGRICQALNRIRENDNPVEYEVACWTMLGGEMPGNCMNNLAAGVSHLAGRFIMFHLGSHASSLQSSSTFVPIPSCLNFLGGSQQIVAMNIAVTNEALNVMNTCLQGPKKIFVSEGVYSAIVNAHRTGQRPTPKQFVAKSPEEVVSYIEASLQSGRATWKGGMMRFVSTNYRGTILFGICCRIVGNQAEFYKNVRWAREFIELADEVWHVRRDGAYATKGSCFRTSFQVNMIDMELAAFQSLRGSEYKFNTGRFPLVDEFKLAKKLADMAADPFAEDVDSLNPYQRMTMEVAFQRKPTASVHGHIAAVLKQCNSKFSTDVVFRLLKETGFINAGDQRSIYAIIVEHYLIAAEAQLPDADDAAILWWGAAANMAEAPEEDAFTMGEFRYAMRMADKACRARDVGLFGPDDNLGGSYHTESTIILERFAGEDDSFVLPKTHISSNSNGTASLEVEVNGVNEVLCTDIGDRMKAEQRRHAEQFGRESEEDVSGVEDKHGIDSDLNEFPSLTVLCVRALHKEDFKYARGESDPACIILKAYNAGILGKEDEK